MINYEIKLNNNSFVGDYDNREPVFYYKDLDFLPYNVNVKNKIDKNTFIGVPENDFKFHMKVEGNVFSSYIVMEDLIIIGKDCEKRDEIMELLGLQE